MKVPFSTVNTEPALALLYKVKLVDDVRDISFSFESVVALVPVLK